MPTLTEVVHAELGRVPVARRCCRRAEIATMLRLSAAPRHLDGRLVVEADLDEVVAARRLHTLVTAAFGYPVRLQSLPAPEPGQAGQYRVSVGGVADRRCRLRLTPGPARQHTAQEHTQRTFSRMFPGWLRRGQPPKKDLNWSPIPCRPPGRHFRPHQSSVSPS